MLLTARWQTKRGQSIGIASASVAPAALRRSGSKTRSAIGVELMDGTASVEYPHLLMSPPNTHRETDRQTDRQTERHTYRQIQTYIHTDRQTYRQTD